MYSQFIPKESDYPVALRLSKPFRRMSLCSRLVIVILFPFANPLWAQNSPSTSESEKIAENRKNFAHADDYSDEDLALLDMDVPIVVTAARRGQEINTVPYAISVVTRKDIRLSGARSVPDALRLVPGVDVGDISFGNSVVGTRGFHGFAARFALILVDGRQIYDSMFGGTLWGSWPFQLEDIERIEVIRGPGGVTWGANAVNGVINIITRDPADQKGLTITSGAGIRGWTKQHIGYAAGDDKFRFRLSAEYEGSNGFDEGYSFFGNSNDDYHCGRASFHGIYQPDKDNTFTFSTGTSLLHDGYSSTPMVGFNQEINAGSNANYLLGNWKHTVSDEESFELTAFVNDFWISPGVQPFEYRYQQLALQFGHTFKLNSEHTLTWGMDSRIDFIDGSLAHPPILTQDHATSGIVGIYLNDEWKFAPKWRLDMGARIDYEFYSVFQPSARIALSYDITDNSIIYGAVSRAFQVHPVGLRYAKMALLNSLSYITGKKDIDPLTVSACEIGYRARINERFDIGSAAYFQYAEDHGTLSLGLGKTAPIEFLDGNRGRSKIYGLELDARYRATEKLTFLGNYTLAFMDWDGSKPFYETELVTTPKNKFMLGARYDATDDLHLSTHLYYVDNVNLICSNLPLMEDSIDSYLRLDLRAEYEFWYDRASFAVGVRNLLDPDHKEVTTSFLTPTETPRMIFAEFRVAIP